MAYEQKPLYRKVNTKARNVHHDKGKSSAYDRNTKAGMGRSMGKDVRRGLDYTPLYKFLHASEGKCWDDVYKEIVPRILDKEHIFYIVQDDNKGPGYVRIGESSRYSTMYVDENNILRFVKTEMKNEDFTPDCTCCTHTFNGKILNNKVKGNELN